MRRSSTLLGTALVAVLVAPAPEPAIAQCSGPYFEDIDNLVLTRGTTVTIEGRSFADGCSDSMGCSVGPGCDDCDYDQPVQRPRQDIRLELTQGDRSWSLDIADAGTAEDDQLGWVTWTFKVPRSAKPGPAKLLVDYATSAKVRIR